jgi:hypothetical protein
MAWRPGGEPIHSLSRVVRTLGFVDVPPKESRAVAIDQSPLNSPTESMAVPAIDNEFPTYRAISPSAVLSLVFGIGSVFCFADLWFLLLSATSVGLGLYAQKKIRQFPEVLTGAGLARVGIGVGLLFGLTALSQVLAEEFTIRIDAGRFARFYITVIKDKPISESLWYQQPLAYRKDRTPDELVDELKKGKAQMGIDPYTAAAKPIQEMKERLDGGKGGDLVYESIESKALDGLTTYANALVKLEIVKPTADHPETEVYALFKMVKGSDEWMVREVTFPYTPKSSTVSVEKKVDDGHGH